MSASAIDHFRNGFGRVHVCAVVVPVDKVAEELAGGDLPEAPAVALPSAGDKGGAAPPKDDPDQDLLDERPDGVAKDKDDGEGLDGTGRKASEGRVGDSHGPAVGESRPDLPAPLPDSDAAASTQVILPCLLTV